MIVKSPVAIGIPFNPSGTLLTSIDVESAIKEIANTVASGILNYNVVSSAAFSTSSTTDVVITGLTVTPQSGTYAVFFNSDATVTQNNANITHTIYKAGAAVTDSIRRTQSVSANFIFQQSSISIVQFNGSQACDVRVKTSQGTLTVNGRTLVLVRLGP